MNRSVLPHTSADIIRAYNAGVESGHNAADRGDISTEDVRVPVEGMDAQEIAMTATLIAQGKSPHWTYMELAREYLAWVDSVKAKVDGFEPNDPGIRRWLGRQGLPDLERIVTRIAVHAARLAMQQSSVQLAVKSLLGECTDQGVTDLRDLASEDVGGHYENLTNEGAYQDFLDEEKETQS